MNRNRRRGTKILAVALAGSLLLGSSMGTVSAAEDSSPKEEVVYAILNAYGSVEGVYVVNSFAGGNIVDYGNYTSVKNMTTSDVIESNGEKITFHTEKEKVWYQGDLETKDIPWDIKIQYFLDGKSCEAEELAGKTGALELKISITQNEACDTSFWEGYALQTTVVLDGKKSTNIVAENGTVANAGSQKQISYIILPKKGADITITADVEDFEMDAITFQGTKLNMDLEVESEELEDQIAKLQETAAAINDGSTSVENGVKALRNGLENLEQGIQSMNSALTAVDAKSKNLTESSEKVLTSLQLMESALEQGNQNLANQGMTMDSYLASHDAAINGLSQMMVTATSEQQAVYQQVLVLLETDKSYLQQSSQLGGGIQELEKNYEQLNTGIKTYTNAVSEIAKGGNTLAQGASKLVQGGESLAQGTKELSSGTNKFSEKTAGMDKEISDSIDETMADMTGENVKTVSFVSEKNTNVESVLFVIRTPEIEKPEADTEDGSQRVEKEKNFWEKLKDLFQ